MKTDEIALKLSHQIVEERVILHKPLHDEEQNKWFVTLKCYFDAAIRDAHNATIHQLKLDIAELRRQHQEELHGLDSADKAALEITVSASSPR